MATVDSEDSDSEGRVRSLPVGGGHCPARALRVPQAHQQTGVKLLGLIFFSSNYWQLLAIIGYYHDWYYWFAKSITIIGYYWTTPISLIIGINRNLLLRLIFLDTNYCN